MSAFDIKFSLLSKVKADLEDFDDCAKMFICQLNAKNDSTMGPVEKMMKKSFSAGSTTNYGRLDVNRVSARFDLAALTGKMVGLKQCKLFYGRCKIPYLQGNKTMTHFSPECYRQREEKFLVKIAKIIPQNNNFHRML